MLPIEQPTERVKKILIIEDDEMIAGIYKRKFESAGFEVQVEMDGSEGYYRIYKTHPDAVLLDLLLPGMDGPAIIRKFRAQRKFADLPIIAFTNAYLSDVGRDAVTAGATQIFNKATVTPQEIVAAIVSSLNRNIAPVVMTAPVPFDPQSDQELAILAEPSFHSDQTKVSPTPPPPNQVAAQLAQGGAKVEESLYQPEQPTPTASSHQIPSPAVPATQPQSAKLNAEIAFQTAVLDEFVQKSGARIDGMRQILRTLQIEPRRTPKVEAFIDMARIAHKISCNAAVIGLHYLAHIAAAVEALAWELFEKPKQFGIPTRQAFAKAIDMIARLVDVGSTGQLKEFSQFNILVVDDDSIARKMIARTLDRAKLSHVATGRPELAMELLQENEFDLVILDVKMDGMSGFEVCSALRQMAHQQHCQVLFVSGLNDFQSRVASTQSGGNDFIVKPFAPMELALKALLHMVTAQLDKELDAIGVASGKSKDAPQEAPLPNIEFSA